MEKALQEFKNLEISPEKVQKLENYLELIVGRIEKFPDELEQVSLISEKIEELLKYLEISHFCQSSPPTKIPSLVFRLLHSAGSVSIRDVLELVNLEISSAMFILTSTLVTKGCPFHLSASKILSSLSSPSAAFSAAPPSEDENMEILTSRYSRYVNALIKSIIECNVVDAYGRCIVFHQNDHAETDALIKDFMNLIMSCFKLCSQYQKQLRMHIATQTSIVRDILLPYLDNLIPIFKIPGAPVDVGRVEWSTLAGVLKALAAVSFNIKIFRKLLHSSERWLTILEISSAKPDVLVALLKLAINADFSEASFWSEFLNQAHKIIHETLNEPTVQRVISRLTNSAKDGISLVASSNAKAPILSLFDQAPVVSISQAIDPFAVLEISTDNCALSGIVMTDPVVAPGNFYFERSAITDWLEKNAFCPISGKPLKIEDLKEAPEMLEKLQRAQIQTIQPQKLSPPKLSPPKLSPELQPVVEIASSGENLLGDLPPLEKQKISLAPKIKVDRGNLKPPLELRCAIDGKIMTDPVRTPYGHCFERVTISRWIETLGSVCPLTNKPLRMADCTPDLELRAKIEDWLRISK